MRNLFSGKRDAFEFPFRFILGQVRLSVICREAILRILNLCLGTAKVSPKLRSVLIQGKMARRRLAFGGQRDQREAPRRRRC